MTVVAYCPNLLDGGALLGFWVVVPRLALGLGQFTDSITGDAEQVL